MGKKKGKRRGSLPKRAKQKVMKTVKRHTIGKVQRNVRKVQRRATNSVASKLGINTTGTSSEARAAFRQIKAQRAAAERAADPAKMREWEDNQRRKRAAAHQRNAATAQRTNLVDGVRNGEITVKQAQRAAKKLGIRTDGLDTRFTSAENKRQESIRRDDQRRERAAATALRQAERKREREELRQTRATGRHAERALRQAQRERERARERLARAAEREQRKATAAAEREQARQARQDAVNQLITHIETGEMSLQDAIDVTQEWDHKPPTKAQITELRTAYIARETDLREIAEDLREIEHEREERKQRIENSESVQTDEPDNEYEVIDTSAPADAKGAKKIDDTPPAYIQINNITIG